MAITPLMQAQRAVEAMLANDENSTDDELLTHLTQECPELPAQTLAKLVQQERPRFRREVLHTIDWEAYGLAHPGYHA